MAWAVGDYFTGHEGGPHGAFIERWNGQRWRIAAAPIPRGSILWSVSASTAGDAWAVGQTGGGRQLIEHWDGARWRTVAAPRYGAVLNGVVALTPHDAWAVGVRNRGGGGTTLIEHWNGTRWAIVSSPNPARGRVVDRSRSFERSAHCRRAMCGRPGTRALAFP